jgi:hypothetical protein
MKLEGRFSYTGSSAYDLSNIEVSPNGLALFDAVTGVGGIDYMPYDGATVFIASGIVNTSGVKNFLPSLNNKAYYLVTNTLYTEADKDTIISLATSITMTLSGSRYTGSFVFSNPSNYEYLYLIWDNVDRIEGGSASYSGGADTKHLDVDFGTDIGVAGVTHTLTGTPSRFILKYNGSVVGDTGYIGLNSTTNYNDLIAAGVDAADIKLTLPLDGLVDNGTGDLLFSKNTSDGSAILSVYSPLAGNTWSLTQIDPSLTSFYLDTDNGTLSNVCSQTANTQMYHDGVNALPVNGDRIYRDSAGVYAFDGANSYHLISTTSMGAPPVSGGVFLAIDADGVAYAYGECDCSEVAIPVIDQDDLSFVMGEQVDITISATNNPTSWEVVSSCDKYILTGGDKGSIFSVTDCNGVTKNVTVNINQSTTVCATAAALSFGTGTATLNGACVDSVFPRGLSFDTNTGRLYGIPEDTCSYSVELIATNCFGDSINTTIVIDVASGVKITPFAMDVENFADNGTDACLISPVYTLVWHNGVNNLPTLNDTIFSDHKGIERFMGGERFYKVQDSLDSIKICHNGKVCDTHTC